jgi:hypothetical protein
MYIIAGDKNDHRTTFWRKNISGSGLAGNPPVQMVLVQSFPGALQGPQVPKETGIRLIFRLTGDSMPPSLSCFGHKQLSERHLLLDAG